MMRLRERERFDALCVVREVVQRGDWAVLDLETTRLETMRRLVLHLAAQEPLVLAAPKQEGNQHARRTT